MREPEFIIKIAADSVINLRRIDVFRVLDSCSNDELALSAAYIRQNRPDLAKEVSDCLFDILAE
jgi:hypothetical protein